MSNGLPSVATAPTLANYQQLFRSLLGFRWREVDFPYVETELDLVQDQVIHKFVDRDGAHVEGVGRAPFRITARIPFLVGLQSGPNEHWQRPLYPFTWRKFFVACADKSSGTLQHPELGDLTVKCESAKTRWSGQVQTGVYVDVTWIETDDSQVGLETALESASPLAGLDASAADLDNQLATLNPSLFPQSPTLQFSFSSLVSSIRGAIDSVTILEKTTAGRLANVIYEAQTVLDATNQAANASSLNWPIINQANASICGASDLQLELLNKQTAGILYYEVVKDSTIAQVAAVLGADISDILTLNAGLAISPIVLTGTLVRYYASDADA